MSWIPMHVDRYRLQIGGRGVENGKVRSDNSLVLKVATREPSGGAAASAVGDAVVVAVGGRRVHWEQATGFAASLKIVTIGEMKVGTNDAIIGFTIIIASLV